MRKWLRCLPDLLLHFHLECTNGYSYTENNPINFSDPSGLLTAGLCSGGGASLPGIFGQCTTCYVLDSKGVGKTVNYGYGGTTSVGGVNGYLGLEVTNAENLSQLEGRNTIAGGSAQVGPVGVSVEGQSGGGVNGVSGGYSPGFEPTYALPGEVHGGQQHTEVVSYKEYNQISPADVAKVVVDYVLLHQLP